MLLIYTIATIVAFLFKDSNAQLQCLGYFTRTSCEADASCHYFTNGETCGCGEKIYNTDIAIVTDFPNTCSNGCTESQTWKNFVNFLQEISNRILVNGNDTCGNKMAIYVSRNANGTDYEQIMSFSDPLTMLTDVSFGIPYRKPTISHACKAITRAVADLDACHAIDPTRLQKLSVLQWRDDDTKMVNGTKMDDCTIGNLPIREDIGISGFYDALGLGANNNWASQMAQLDFEKYPNNSHISEVDHYSFQVGFHLAQSGPAFFSEHWCEKNVPTSAPTSSPTRNPTSPTTSPTKTPTEMPIPGNPFNPPRECPFSNYTVDTCLDCTLPNPAEPVEVTVDFAEKCDEQAGEFALCYDIKLLSDAMFLNCDFTYGVADAVTYQFAFADCCPNTGQGYANQFLAPTRITFSLDGCMTFDSATFSMIDAEGDGNWIIDVTSVPGRPGVQASGTTETVCFYWNDPNGDIATYVAPNMLEDNSQICYEGSNGICQCVPMAFPNPGDLANGTCSESRSPTNPPTDTPTKSPTDLPTSTPFMNLMEPTKAPTEWPTKSNVWPQPPTGGDHWQRHGNEWHNHNDGSWWSTSSSWESSSSSWGKSSSSGEWKREWGGWYRRSRLNTPMPVNTPSPWTPPMMDPNPCSTMSRGDAMCDPLRGVSCAGHNDQFEMWYVGRTYNAMKDATEFCYDIYSGKSTDTFCDLTEPYEAMSHFILRFPLQNTATCCNYSNAAEITPACQWPFDANVASMADGDNYILKFTGGLPASGELKTHCFEYAGDVGVMAMPGQYCTSTVTGLCTCAPIQVPDVITC